MGSTPQKLDRFLPWGLNPELGVCLLSSTCGSLSCVCCCPIHAGRKGVKQAHSTGQESQTVRYMDLTETQHSPSQTLPAVRGSGRGALQDTKGQGREVKGMPCSWEPGSLPQHPLQEWDTEHHIQPIWGRGTACWALQWGEGCHVWIQGR